MRMCEHMKIPECQMKWWPPVPLIAVKRKEWQRRQLHNCATPCCRCQISFFYLTLKEIGSLPSLCIYLRGLLHWYLCLGLAGHGKEIHFYRWLLYVKYHLYQWHCLIHNSTEVSLLHMWSFLSTSEFLHAYGIPSWPACWHISGRLANFYLQDS